MDKQIGIGCKKILQHLLFACCVLIKGSTLTNNLDSTYCKYSFCPFKLTALIKMWFRVQPIYMPSKGLTKAKKVHRKVFEQSHATFEDQSAPTSTWTRLAGTSSGSVEFTMEKVAVGLEPPPKRRRTDEKGQPSSSFPSASTLDSSSIPIADSPSPSTSEVATNPDGQAPASKKPTTPIKPYILKPPLSNESLTSRCRANLHFWNSRVVWACSPRRRLPWVPP